MGSSCEACGLMQSSSRGCSLMQSPPGGCSAALQRQGTQLNISSCKCTCVHLVAGCCRCKGSLAAALPCFCSCEGCAEVSIQFFHLADVRLAVSGLCQW